MTTDSVPAHNDYEHAWQLLTGRDDPWGGCAYREAVERIAAGLATARADGAPVYPLLDERFKAADVYLAEGQTQLTDAELTPRVRTALANAFAGGMMHQFKIDDDARTVVPLTTEEKK